MRFASREKAVLSQWEVGAGLVPGGGLMAQIAKVRAHPWIAKDIPVRGFIFDVDTGRLQEVAAG